MSVLLDSSASPPPEYHESGERIAEAQPGSLVCIGCGFAFSLAALDALPLCPRCGGSRFRRASLFDQPTIDADAVDVAEEEPEWFAEARAQTTAPGDYLAFEGPGGEPIVLRLKPGWTRIGRSVNADIRFNDATVSRRHALVVLTEDGELRVLDDRSLNGLFVNGNQVEWARLSDGDELEIGRYRVYVMRV